MKDFLKKLGRLAEGMAGEIQLEDSASPQPRATVTVHGPDGQSWTIDGMMRPGGSQRYAADIEDRVLPDALQLTIYAKDAEPASFPLSVADWQAFATWGAEQGGELARLCVEGHTDAYGPADAIVALSGQLMRLKDPPADFAATLELIQQAVDRKGVEGLVVEEV